ncbi:hypothetical protein BGP_4398 [Beggiatoa sp. PS]|nr:hypothetical protein BGP_4398 [Beggiatoa sp. PS]
MKSKKQIVIPEVKQGEYIPSFEPTPHQVKPKRGCLGRLISSFIWMFIFITLVFFLLMFGRQWYDSILARLDYDKSVHADNSVIKTGIRSQVRPTITLVYKDKQGKKVKVIADAQEYSTFVNQQVASLDHSRTKQLAKMETQLNDTLTEVFDEVRGRIDRFADWYFAYITTYKILWEATTSATKHVLSAEAISLSDAVSYDVEKYLHKHYENIVLRPEITDPQLKAAYQSVLKEAHDYYLNVLSTTQKDFQVFVSRYTTHIEVPATENTELALDWESQFNKMNMAEYEKGPRGAALGAALAAGGAATGKVVASAASKGIASKAIVGTATKSIFAKLSAPFVSKAVLVGAGGAVGTLAGPLGTIIGAVGGLGIDFAINEGVELTQRETFVTDVNAALLVTQNEWEKQMHHSLQEAINIWIDDTIQLLPRYKKT